MSDERPTITDIERALTALTLAGKAHGAQPTDRAVHDRAVRLHRATLKLIERFALQSYETGVDMGRQSAMKGSVA